MEPGARRVRLSVVVPPGTKAKDVVVECTEDRVKVVLANHARYNRRRRCVDDDIAHGIDPEPRDDEELERSVDGFDVPRVYGEGRCATGSRSRWEGARGSRDVSEERAGRHDALVAQGAAQREGDRHRRAEVSEGGRRRRARRSGRRPPRRSRRASRTGSPSRSLTPVRRRIPATTRVDAKASSRVKE